MTDTMQALDEMVAELFRDGSPISTSAEPQPTTSISQPTIDEAVSEAGAIEPAGDGGNIASIADRPRSVLDGLNLDTAIRLRWALRDIKARRTEFSPVSQNDLMALIELGLIEMDDVAQLTNEGHRSLGLELRANEK